MSRVGHFILRCKPTWLYIVEYTPRGIFLHASHNFIRHTLAVQYCKRLKINLKSVEIVKGRQLLLLYKSGAKIRFKKQYGLGFNWKKYDYDPDMPSTAQAAKSLRTKVRRQARGGKIVEVAARKKKARKQRRINRNTK